MLAIFVSISLYIYKFYKKRIQKNPQTTKSFMIIQACFNHRNTTDSDTKTKGVHTMKNTSYKLNSNKEKQVRKEHSNGKSSLS